MVIRGRSATARSGRCRPAALPFARSDPQSPRRRTAQIQRPRTVQVSTTTARLNSTSDAPLVTAEGVGVLADPAICADRPPDVSAHRRPAWSISPAAVAREPATAGCRLARRSRSGSLPECHRWRAALPGADGLRIVRRPRRAGWTGCAVEIVHAIHQTVRRGVCNCHCRTDLEMAAGSQGEDVTLRLTATVKSSRVTGVLPAAGSALPRHRRRVAMPQAPS